MDDHPTDQTLSSYGLGKLDDARVEAVVRHLENCPDCRGRVAVMSADSFLDRVRDARKPSGISTSGPSRPDGTWSYHDTNAPVPPPAETLPPGLADHPDYEIRKELGRGGMGVVYLAHNRLLGRDEVLKVMGRHIMERPGVLDRFLREIRAVARLRHPNIVTAYSAVRLGESIVFAMEYVEGLDLSKLVKAKGPLPIAHACNFVHQAALGLQHAHEEGLVHRDVKPGNLMLAKKGDKPVVKVLDFGLAKVAREEKVDGGLTTEGQALGTPDYIAPEQILDAPSADVRADIYSLGVTLYYLLTGRPPFKANSLYDIYQAHISREAEPLNFVRPEVPAELAALVAKMMTKDPKRRFQTPGEVAQALTPFFKSGNMAFKSPRADVSGAGQANAGRLVTGAARTPTVPATNADAPLVLAKKAAQPTVPETRWERLIDFKETDSSIEATPAAAPERRPPWASWPMIVAASVLGTLLLGVIIYIITDKGRIKIVVDGPRPVVRIDGEIARIEGLGEPITLRAGPHVMRVEWGDGQFEQFETHKFVVRRGHNEELLVEYKPRVTPSSKPRVTPSSEDEVSIEVFNSRGAFVRHRSGKAYVEPILTPPDCKDACFKKVPGLADSDGVTFESTNNPGMYLRHSFGRLILTRCPRWLDKLDATFLIRKGLAYEGEGWISLAPFNYQTAFLQNRNGELWTTLRQEEAEFKKSATFRFVKPQSTPAGTPEPKTIANSIGMKLRLIPAGSFLMGATPGDTDAGEDEKPQHKVTITRPFYLGVYEVTQREYRQVMNNNPSRFKDSELLPVEQVSWLDAVRFCNTLSERERRKPYYKIEGDTVTILGGNGYRLPTEAEWEYACRAGSPTKHPFGGDDANLKDYAWFGEDFPKGGTHRVGQKKPNRWGLYDMQGNVWEWCQDWYSPATASLRVIRGGCWDDSPGYCRPAGRYRGETEDREGNLGFRLAADQQ